MSQSKIISITRRNLITDFEYLTQTEQLPEVNEKQKHVLLFLHKSSGAQLEEIEALNELEELYKLL